MNSEKINKEIEQLVLYMEPFAYFCYYINIYYDKCKRLLPFSSREATRKGESCAAEQLKKVSELNDW
ncbi:hypothetical protein R4Z09_04695 [Niallia oryzisoli]|uniref:Uncharacterized protein n=1 Tax=Niallia oryzisoli TaxID=1737571 RepID=A0ABZ2CEW3_9BACI